MTIGYLGHNIRRRRLENASHTTDVISGLKDPTDITEVCSFLRLCIVFQELVLFLTHLAAPLNVKQRIYKPVAFGTLHEDEFMFLNSLKCALI